MSKKIFIFGSGPWSRNYINEIEKVNDLKLSAIITNNQNFIKNKYRIYKDLKDAIKVSGNPDGIIVCTRIDNILNIYKEISQLNVPIILEKPICQVNEINKFKIIFKNKFHLLLVNHFHFYDDFFVNNIQSINKNEIKVIKIIDGNSGPEKKISPILDWGSHSFGIIKFFLSDELDIIIKKKINIDSEYKFNTFFNIIENKSNKKASVLIGNNFKSKKRLLKIYLNNDHKIIYEVKDNSYYLLNKLPSPLQNLLNDFSKIIDNNSKNKIKYLDSLNISLNSIVLINDIISNNNFLKDV